nr:dihydrofolate reductase family protein [Amycolatopsis palatopharyngis]
MLGDDVVANVVALKDRPGQEIQVVGSGDLVQTLMRHDLVDEYRLWIFPVLLGSGKRLFANGTQPAGLAIAGTAISDTGVAMYTYERVGAPTYGSFAPDREPGDHRHQNGR